ncbi:MAG: ABC transporter ATP-binding protein [Kiritimatiellae bacterium]|nr:ABC transporter ATP-binding protein [Kiritimatiellia bacterium]
MQELKLAGQEEPLLEIRHLSVTFRHEGVETTPVHDVSLRVNRGERVAVVGESGCGKSLTAMSVTQLSPTDRARLGGEILFEGEDLLRVGKKRLEEVRGQGIAYVFQDPSASLNPVMRVYRQITETNRELSKAERIARTEHLLEEVGLPDPPRLARAYPCEMSGGQQQRVMLAIALAQKPRLLIADEPTTALDVTTQQKVLDLIDALAVKYNMAVLLITHNLGLVAGRMQRVYVLYSGYTVESGDVRDILLHPQHPYTKGLLAAVPRLDAPKDQPLADIPGTVPSPDDWPPGCVFEPRCGEVLDRCRREVPPIHRLADGRMCACWKRMEDASCCCK